MKKILTVLLMSLLLICLAVSCKDEVEEKDSYVAKIVVTDSNSTRLPNGVYYIKSVDDYNHIESDRFYDVYSDEACANESTACFNFVVKSDGTYYMTSSDDLLFAATVISGFTPDYANGTITVSAGEYELPTFSRGSVHATVTLYLKEAATFGAKKLVD